MEPEFDIIVPAYNPGTYIVEALESCFRQSYKKIRVTVVDDCSSQDLKFILKKFPKVQLLRTEKNVGPAGARNLGIKNTSAEFVSFLDADDIMSPGKIDLSLEEFKKSKSIGMTCGNYQIFVNRSRLMSPFYKKAPLINWRTLMRQNLVASGSVTVRRTVLEEVGGFDERFWIAEDYATWLKISERHSINYIHKVLYYYSYVNLKNSSLTHRDDIQAKHLENLKIIKAESEARMKDVRTS